MYSPQEIESLYDTVGQKKVMIPIYKMIVMGILAGIFIALAAVGANTGASMVSNPGLAKLISALIFPAGLAMVVLAGSELFTGDCLIIISKLDKKITWQAMLKCWVAVYIGNFIGAILVAFLMIQCHQLSLFANDLSLFTIQTAVAKTSLTPVNALILGVFCNFLVCIAVWIGMAGATVTEKLAGLYLPIFLFVLSGFEHSVANMYYIPAGLFAAADSTYANFAIQHGVSLVNLTWSNFFLRNLFPVTIGNIIGGGCMVGVVYWFMYQKKGAVTVPAKQKTAAAIAHGKALK